jgi:hypothetical protein
MTAARVSAWTFVVAGVALTVIRQLGASPEEADLVGFAWSVLYGAIVASPGVVALRTRRPLVLAATGVAGVVLGMISSFGVTLPLLAPAIVIVVAGGKRLDSHVRLPDAWRAALAAVLPTWTMALFVVTAP